MYYGPWAKGLLRSRGRDAAVSAGSGRREAAGLDGLEGVLDLAFSYESLGENDDSTKRAIIP